MFKPLSESLALNLERLGKHKVLLQDVLIGLERETLRVKTDGKLSQEPHNPALGSAFTHPHITTDFSENLLEFVTQPHSSAEAVLEELDKIQAFTLLKLPDELLWANSMPPKINTPDEIPIGYYGTSNAGKMKRLYRMGLSHRYGKMMQTIAGIHFNFSLGDEFFAAFQGAIRDTQPLQDFKTKRYLNLVRNVSRFGFIIPYFFGASPLVSKSFLPANMDHFKSFNDEDSYLDEGMSFRLSNIGYGNNKCEFDVSFNHIDEYIRDIKHAISTPCHTMTELGIKKDGEYLQINDHILQIENEYYASIRPKQILHPNETLLNALSHRGIEYVELRSLDVRPDCATGIDVPTLKFLQAFLTTCLLADAKPLSKEENKLNQKNLKLVAEKGRNPELKVLLNRHHYHLSDALRFVIEWMRPVCELLGDDFVSALNAQKKICDHPEKTFAAAIIEDLSNRQITFQEFCLQQAKEFKKDYAVHNPLSPQEIQDFEELAQQSCQQQSAIEQKPQSSFDEYLTNYFQ